MTLDLFGTPRKYPQDTYVHGISNRVEQPAGYAVVTTMRAEGQLLLEYTVNNQLIPSSMFLNPEKSRLAETFRMQLQRPSSLVLFTYAMALAPTLLLIAITIQYLRTRGAAVLSAEAALTVLTLLPLRQVLVPESLRAPTRVDLVLACELTLFIAVAGVVAARRVPTWMVPPATPRDAR